MYTENDKLKAELAIKKMSKKQQHEHLAFNENMLVVGGGGGRGMGLSIPLLLLYLGFMSQKSQ